MAFTKGHPPYLRRSNLAIAEPNEERPAERTVGRPTNAELAERYGTEDALIRRWSVDDFDDWLATRLKKRWEGTDWFWRNKLLGFTQGNDYLFITNGDAVLLAMQQRHAMIGKPVVAEIFAWARDVSIKDGVYGASRRTEEGLALKPLYRRLRAWGKAMDATRVYVGVCSDILPRDLLESMGDHFYYVVAGPC